MYISRMWLHEDRINMSNTVYVQTRHHKPHRVIIPTRGHLLEMCYLIAKLKDWLDNEIVGINT